MLTTGLFAGYSFGVGAIIYNLSKIKLQDDFEREIRDLREYDIQNEMIKAEKDLPANCMVLAKYIPSDNPHIKFQNPKLGRQSEDTESKLMFSKVVAFSNVLDPTRYFKVNNL